MGSPRSEFKLPWLSPLAGATWPIVRKVLKGNQIDPQYRLKIWITYIFLTINSLFQWFDNFWMHWKVKHYTFKEPPLFIIGHWRSGTTYLHNLMTEDPAAAYTTTYQCVFPQNLKSKWVFKTFMRTFMPRFRPGDNLEISASWPQEDEYAIRNLTHRSFYHFFYFPSNYRTLYKKYIRFETLSKREVEDWKELYRNLVIKALVNTGGSRIILKSPVNTARMLKLLELFPDANFIHIVRNPMTVYLSTKKFFTQLFPTLQLEPFSESEISELILDIYPAMLKDYLEDRKQLDPDRLMEIKYEDLIREPMKHLAHIYHSFNYPGLQELEPVFEDYLLRIEGYQADSYTIDKNELKKVMERVDFAMKEWNYGLPDDLKIE